MPLLNSEVQVYYWKITSDRLTVCYGKFHNKSVLFHNVFSITFRVYSFFENMNENVHISSFDKTIS